MHVHCPPALLLALLLLAATPSSATAAPSTPGASPVVLLAAAATLAAAYWSAQRLLSATPERKRPATAIRDPEPCVVQRDEQQERAAERSVQQHPLNAAVTLRTDSGAAQCGVVCAYDASADTYDVELPDGKTTAVRASALETPVVHSLVVYPVKSCGGISLDAVQLTPKGLQHDRQWMVVDAATNRFATQRRYPRMALVQPKLLPSEHDTGLLLTAEGMPDLEVPVVRAPQASERIVSVWESKEIEAEDQGDAAAQWLDAFMAVEGHNFRLVRIKDSYTRHTSPKYAPGHATCFADGFPFLLALEESLQEFNETLEEPVPMNRFRPNIVLSGSPAFADEHWNCVLVGGLRFRNVKPCSRCGMPSVNQATGEVHKRREPSRAIVRERNGKLLGFVGGKKTDGYFGSNMVLELDAGADSEPLMLQVGASAKVLSLKHTVVA